jgi:capsular exopolysaccharide synthesis family protein
MATQPESYSQPIVDAPAADLSEYLRILLAGKWIVLSITALTMMCSIIYHASLPNLYMAKVQILVEKTENSTRSFQDVVPSIRVEEEYYGTKIAILSSRKIAAMVEAELGDVAKDYSLYAERLKGTRIVNVYITHRNPEDAAKIANKFAEIFAREGSKDNLFVSKQILKFIPDEKEIKTENEVAPNAVTEKGEEADSGKNPFDKKQFAESLSKVTSDPVIQKMRTEKLEIESQLTQLSQRYKPEHPSIKELRERLNYVEAEMADRTSKIVNNVKADLSGKMNITNIRVLEEALPPTSPSEPNRLKGVILHTIGGLAVSIVLLIFFEQSNQKVRIEKDLVSVANLPFLGYIPLTKDLIKNKKGVSQNVEEEHSYINGLRENTMLSDAVASVRTHILFSMPYEKSRKIMFTSAVPNEGKSTVASLLALSLTSLGRKILLIDADLRKPYLHNYLGVENHKGLTDFLMGTATWEEVIRPVTSSTLKIITAGNPSPNPSELLASDNFKNMLDKALEQYDRVIVDVPPVLYIPDGLIIAKHVHSGVLVCGSGMIHKKVLQSVIQKFNAIGHTFVGIVINRVDYEKNQYRYSYYNTYKDYYAKSDPTKKL